jgi:hypothetical protein
MHRFAFYFTSSIISLVDVLQYELREDDEEAIRCFDKVM